MSAPLLTPLRRIATPQGDVLHGMKASDPGFAGFGEAYFTQVHAGAIKGWKRHRAMTLNLICVQGAVRLVVYDEARALRCDATLSPDRAETYFRLTVPPGYWVAFQGVGQATSMLLNLASLAHDPAEAETSTLDALPWPGDTPPHGALTSPSGSPPLLKRERKGSDRFAVRSGFISSFREQLYRRRDALDDAATVVSPWPSA